MGVGGDVGDSSSPYAQEKHRPATGCHAPGQRPGSRLGPYLDQNVLGQLRRGNPDLNLVLSGGLFSAAVRPRQRPSPIWRKRGTRKSRLETKSENEASSALLARLWYHLILQNPTNRAENLIRLCSAAIG